MNNLDISFSPNRTLEKELEGIFNKSYSFYLNNRFKNTKKPAD